MYKTGAVAVAVLISGCTVTGPDPMDAFGIPNPASVYCIERGGTLDIEERAEGQVSICVLSNEPPIEEWKLYRRDHPQG